MERAESGADQAALKSWYKGLLDRLVPDLVKAGAITGAAVEARPVWAAPEQILIARVWNAAQKSQFIWAIVVKDVVTDHIAGSAAASAKEAARHFSLKWQMDADRLLRAVGESVQDEAAAAEIRNYARRLVALAEQMYELSQQEEVWQRKIAG